MIISCFEKWKEDQSLRFCYLSPERINYVDDEHDGELLAEYSSALERGEDIPSVDVFETDGEFYIDKGQESALAYSFNLFTFVPATLVRADIGERKYVKMKNSL